MSKQGLYFSDYEQGLYLSDRDYEDLMKAYRILCAYPAGDTFIEQVSHMNQNLGAVRYLLGKVLGKED